MVKGASFLLMTFMLAVGFLSVSHAQQSTTALTGEGNIDSPGRSEKSGEARAVFPRSETQFTGGPALYVASPTRQTLTFRALEFK